MVRIDNKNGAKKANIMAHYIWKSQKVFFVAFCAANTVENLWRLSSDQLENKIKNIRRHNSSSAALQRTF